MDILSSLNNHAMRVAIVEYTAQMSGGFSTADFSNTSVPDQGQRRRLSHGAAFDQPGIRRDLATNDLPVSYNSTNYFGSLILNPDLMGAIQQGGFAER